MWETDLTFCISEMASAGQPGFYLIMGMGSEQACLTEFKGSIVPKVAVDRFRVLSSKVAYCNQKCSRAQDGGLIRTDRLTQAEGFSQWRQAPP